MIFINLLVNKLCFQFYDQLNLLMPELNPSKQCCLLEFFTGDFKFESLLLRKEKRIA